MNKTLGKEIDELAHFSSYMMKWMDRQAKSSTTVDFEREVNVMTGTEFIASLAVDGFDPEKITHLKTIVEYVFAEQAQESEWIDPKAKEAEEPQLSAATQTVFDGFFMIVDLMLGENQFHRDDYRAVVVKTIERRRGKASQNNFFG